MSVKRSDLFNTELDKLTDLQLNVYVPHCLGMTVLGLEASDSNTVIISVGGKEQPFNAVEVNHNLVAAIILMAKLSVIQEDSGGVYIGQNLHTELVGGLPILVGDNMVQDTSLIRGVYRCLLKFCSGGTSYVTAYVDYERAMEVPMLTYVLNRSTYSFE